jgi:hypothetical protein
VIASFTRGFATLPSRHAALIRAYASTFQDQDERTPCLTADLRPERLQLSRRVCYGRWRYNSPTVMICVVAANPAENSLRWQLIMELRRCFAPSCWPVLSFEKAHLGVYGPFRDYDGLGEDLRHSDCAIKALVTPGPKSAWPP